MSGITGHALAVMHLWGALNPRTRNLMLREDPEALKSLLTGALVVDVAAPGKWETHMQTKHPIYGSNYRIPDEARVCEAYLKKGDLVSIGVADHLLHDKSFTNDFQAMYGAPNEDGSLWTNKVTGDVYTQAEFWGDGNDNGHMYYLYNASNAEAARRFILLYNSFCGTQYAPSKEGFLKCMKEMYPNGLPKTGIPLMDKYFTDGNLAADPETAKLQLRRRDIVTPIEEYFRDDGAKCQIKVDFDDIFGRFEGSTRKIARMVDKIYLGV